MITRSNKQKFLVSEVCLLGLCSKSKASSQLQQYESVVVCWSMSSSARRWLNWIGYIDDVWVRHVLPCWTKTKQRKKQLNCELTGSELLRGTTLETVEFFVKNE